MNDDKCDDDDHHHWPEIYLTHIYAMPDIRRVQTIETTDDYGHLHKSENMHWAIYRKTDRQIDSVRAKDESCSFQRSKKKIVYMQNVVASRYRL